MTITRDSRADVIAKERKKLIEFFIQSFLQADFFVTDADLLISHVQSAADVLARAGHVKSWSDEEKRWIKEQQKAAQEVLRTMARSR
jgi:hypothetical protein